MTFAEKGFWENILEGLGAAIFAPIFALIGIPVLHFINQAVGGFFLIEFFMGVLVLGVLIVPLLFAFKVVCGLWALVPYEVRAMIFWSLIIIPTGVAIFNLVS